MARESGKAGHGRIQRVACSVCMKEVPKAEAVVRDSSDHVLYFCGPGCVEQWKNWDRRQDADDLRRAIDDGMKDLRIKNV